MNPGSDGGRKPVIPSDLLKSATVSGVVVDVRGNRVAGASVAVGALTAESNDDGEFDFDEIEVADDTTMIVTRDGYSTGRVPFSVSESAPNHVRVTLQAAEKVMLLDPSKGGNVESESGVVLKLKPGQIVDENGEEVTVPVELLVSLINDRDEMAASPGGMMALDPDAAEDKPPTQLESFGMMEVSMTADGKPVKLKGDTETEVELPMAPHHPFAQGEKVGLWHFDEDEGVWKNEGEGEVTAENKMKALVSHFSWWNADQIMTKTCVVGRVIDGRGRGIAAANISGEGRSYLGSSHAMSDDAGNFCLEARVSSVIELSTLVRVGNQEQALAVSVSTPRTKGSCDMPSDCFVLPQELVAVQADALCDPAACPADPAGEKEACCISDLGPCSYVVNGDCGGSEEGKWDEAPEEPGVEAIPGVPMPEPPIMSDAGMSMGEAGRGEDPMPMMDAGMTGTAGESGGAGETGGGAGVTGGTAGETGGGAGTTGGAGTSGGSAGTGADPDPRPDGGTSVIDSGTGGPIDSGTGGQADASAPDPGSCGPAFASACMQCLRSRCDSPAVQCFGDAWRDGTFTGACQNYMECVCDSPTEETSACQTPENTTAQCQSCIAPVFACKDELCSSECDEDTGPEPTPVDRCGDVIPLGSFATVNGTTAGSTLMNDWYDDGRCNVLLQGFERSYSVSIGGGKTLRARVLGQGMQVLIAEQCADIDGSCVAHGADAEYQNYATDNRTVIITVDNFGFDVGAPFTLLMSDEEPSCGDGFRDFQFNEQCDDGNLGTGDGCDDLCRIESGYVCPPDGTCHQVVCGDGIVEGLIIGGGPGGGEVPAGPGGMGSVEQCDDGDIQPGDGCDETCVVENDYVCTGSPSQCMVRPAGDMCSNTLPLATGSYDLVGFSEDYPYAQGRDRMFHGMIPMGQLLEISGTAAFNGQLVVTAAEWCDGGPSRMYPLSANQPFSVTVDRNALNSEYGNVVVIVASSTTGDSSFVFDAIGTVAPSCGDRVVSWEIGEECDDGNVNTGDGCANCHFEPGLLCDFEGNCENRPAGDLCNNADALASGFTQAMYSMVGMSSDDLYCSGPGCDVTRWFKVTQQPGEVTAVLINADFDGFFSLMTGTCPSYGVGGGSGPGEGAGFGPGYLGHVALVNQAPAPRTVWIRVSSSSGATGNFELTTKTGPEGCGDGMRSGEGGPHGPAYADGGAGGPDMGEACDDMNNVGGDGCSPDCHVEFGPFRCPYMGGPCQPIVCGDGFIDRQPNAPYEECDDGNTSSNDGCSATCVMEDGMLCEGEPSDCSSVAPGDVCTNALTLPLGPSMLVLDSYSPDYGCNDLCGGNDGWFTRVLQPRERLQLQIDSSGHGQARAYFAGPLGCHSRFDAGQTSFGAGHPGELTVDNTTTAPVTLLIAVGDYEASTVQLNATVGVPTEDCSSGECVPVVCGDAMRNGTEQCDDGDGQSGDGCSSNCTIEAGFNCYGESTSTCVPLVAGDTCEVAQPLANGTFSLSGFTPDSQCEGSCYDPTRWFHVDVPAGKVLEITADSTNIEYGEVRMIDLAGGFCPAVNGVPFWQAFGTQNGMARGQFMNPQFQTAHLAIVIVDHSATANATFTLNYSLENIGCGDGYRDRFGNFGSPEICDDGGNASGDGCSPTCTQEPGWDCESDICQQVICGDGLRGGAEKCDDGGTDPGDGCSPTCQPEPGYLCGDGEPTCALYQPGDMCSNALPLANGTYGLTNYLRDLPCDDLCDGVDRWFTVSVPPGTTLHVAGSTADPMNGTLVAYDATNGCEAMNPVSGWAPLQMADTRHLVYANTMGGPRTIRIAVMDQAWESSATFTLTHSMQPTGCGDYFVKREAFGGPAEQCDDGNQQNGDGCSSTCMIEPGYSCNGDPSTCVLPQPGDSCSTAQPFSPGSHGLTGYLPGDDCDQLCEGVDRWFTTSVPANKFLVINLSTSAQQGLFANVFEMGGGSCSALTPRLMHDRFMPGPMSRRYIYNGKPVPASFALAVVDQHYNPSMNAFNLDYYTVTPACGDGFHDFGGQYGAPEQCDDNNVLPGDGCSPSCMDE